MDKNVKLAVLVLGGGLGVYLLYKYLKDQGYWAKWFGASASAAPAVSAAAAASSAPASTASAPAAGPIAPHPGGWLPTDYVPCTGGIAVWNDGPDANSANYRTSPQDASKVRCVMEEPPIVPPSCSPNQQLVNGVCQAVAATLSTIQKVQQAAGSQTSLNTDQWCFYYNQIFGEGSCPDPGNIDGSIFAANGLTDRTTPTDVNTWWGVMTQANPGLSGLGWLSKQYLAGEWAA